MNNYTVFVDSSCDTPNEILESHGIKSIELRFRFVDSPEEYKNNDLDTEDFYRNLREGRDAKTSAVNVEDFKMAFEQELREGRDVLYIGFSSGLSTTFNSARLASIELSEAYPERKVAVADTLCASTGYGMLALLAVKRLEEGATIDETVQFVEENRLSICHWFTVDDLQFLHRGGRVGAVAAFVGTAIGIKPVLHVDNNGKLINMFNVRGRKKAIKALVDKMEELAVDPSAAPVYISHGDCIADAESLAQQIKERFGVEVEIITPVGPVIGSHSGPGTLALFFIGKER